jgi:hypothetical protein
MNKKGVFVFGFMLILLIFSVFLIAVLFNKIVRTCNDGTIYGDCSSIKPYFCSNGNLIENASSCGCSNFSNVEGDKCFSDYQVNPKLISLNYTLRGEQGQINFTVYKKLSTHLSELPRYSQFDSSQSSILLDFKLRSLDNDEQKELLLPLIVKIQNITKNKDDQARIAISIVQNIPFGKSDKKIKWGGISLDYYRYPYEVLYDLEGVCGEKSELLAFLLRQIGYGSAFIYYHLENHEALGIQCPSKESLNNSGYCFVETTGPSIISDYKTEYLGVERLSSTPQIIPIQGNVTFGKDNFYELQDFAILDKIRTRMETQGMINFVQHLQFQELKKKYGLEDPSVYTF